jgi:flagellar hook assembly protein FlgD
MVIGFIALAIVATSLPATAAPVQAATRLKAVIVVGPTHSQTASYLSRGEGIAQVAESYGMDVRRVFHPNATWSRVVTEAQGASILVYLGHGNGWPSPYAPFQTDTKDGFGLNPVAGGSANTVKYYGEGPIAANIRLAPNAVVLLNHLCYASGNSEPGQPAPTESVARQRVDNFAAGFLRAGARAVFAYGHQDVSSVIRDLFTTHKTMDQIFMGTGYNGGRDIRFASARTPGYNAHMDPESATLYYRALTGNLSLTADQVTGAPDASTDGTPSTFVVPGAAVVDPNLGAQQVYAAPGGAILAHLQPGTKVRLDAGPVTSSSGVVYYHLSSPVVGYMLRYALDPADSTGPRVIDITPSNGRFSPNGDGVNDTYPVVARFTEPGTWWVRFQRLDGTSLKDYTGQGSSSSGSTWNGTRVTTIQPDGQYRVAAMSTDAWGNVGAYAYGYVWIDTVAPSLSALTAVASSSTPSASPTVFTPNGDGVSDTLPMAYTVTEAGTIAATVKDGAGTSVRSFSQAVSAGSGTLSWDGRTDAGAYAPDGTYTLELRPRDVAGNTGAVRTVSARLLSTLKTHKATPQVFYPKDGDALATQTLLSVTLLRSATVEWRIVNAAGTTLFTKWVPRTLGAGTYSWYWDGRNTAGGLYSGEVYSLVTATTTAGTVSMRLPLTIDAFKIVPSVAAASAGERITFDLISAEPLSSNATLRIDQPGLASYTVATTKISSTTYRVTVTLKSGGSTGTAVIKAWGVDVNGAGQGTYGSFLID